MPEILELLNSLRVEYTEPGGHHHTRAGWIQIKECPFCQSENYHLGFNLQSKYFSCWRCGGLKAFDVLRAWGATRPQIQEFFALRDHLPAETSRPAGRLEEPKHRGPLLKCHREYLRGRKFEPKEIIALWELEGLALARELSWRLYIPIIRKGKRVSWTTRALHDQGLRYVSAAETQEAFPHKHCVYGADLACHSLVVVEGPTDAWRIGPGAGALFGTGFTTAQVQAISRFPFRFILFDNSVSAQAQARELAEQLSCFPGTTTVLECDAKDPGELGAGELKRLRRIAKLPR